MFIRVAGKTKLAHGIFYLFLIGAALACKKSTPSDPVPPPTVNTKKDYSDFDLNDMAARSGYYIADTAFRDGEIKGVVLRKSFEAEFTFPLESIAKSLYIGSSIDGRSFKENNGLFKEYTKFAKNSASYIRADAFAVNLPRDRTNIKITGSEDMDKLVKDYLSGAEPSIYGFSRYTHYPISNYNQLKLIFGENTDIKKLFSIGADENLSKVENGLVYYNLKETIGLKFILDNRPFFAEPFSAEDIRSDEAGYISKVTYGKISIMTISSKLNWRDMRSVVSRVSNNETLSGADLDVLKTARAHTCLIGYTAADQEKLKGAGNALETVKAFLSITNLPKASNSFSSGTFTYGDHGVPLFFEVNSTYSSERFLKNFTYSKTINF